jgi:hypothetical protein
MRFLRPLTYVSSAAADVGGSAACGHSVQNRWTAWAQYLGVPDSINFSPSWLGSHSAQWHNYLKYQGLSDPFPTQSDS